MGAAGDNICAAAHSLWHKARNLFALQRRMCATMHPVSASIMYPSVLGIRPGVRLGWRYGASPSQRRSQEACGQPIRLRARGGRTRHGCQIVAPPCVPQDGLRCRQVSRREFCWWRGRTCAPARAPYLLNTSCDMRGTSRQQGAVLHRPVRALSQPALLRTWRSLSVTRSSRPPT